MTEIALYLLCITLSSMGGLLVMRFARNGRMVDIPGERSSHKEPVPTGGGIGILTAFLFSAFLLRFPPGLWFPPAILALVSLYGDWFRLTPLFRLAIQFVAVTVFLFALFPLMGMGPGPFLLPLLAIFFSVYIVGTANFFNFMDGIDGMLVSTGVITFGFLAIFIVIESRSVLFLKFSLSMAAACLGFLPLNFPRAKVFPGDVGSILIGFLYGGMVVILSKTPLDFAVLAGFAGLLYADVLTTLFIRWRDGENLFLAHRRHLYQILANENGVSHWKVTLLYGMVQIALGGILFALKPHGLVPVLIFLALFFVAFVVFSLRQRRKSAAAEGA
jgi:Fuc2NAc and GlcNAc transferase